MSAALFESLTLTEVVFRNALDDALKRWNPTRGTQFTEEWTDLAAPPLNTLIHGAVNKARSNAVTARNHRALDHPRKTAEITHDDIVAQLTFGVYARLMPTSNLEDPTHDRREILWTEALASAFPGRPGDAPIAHAGRVERLHSLRNRVAHAEPILDVNFRGRARDMARLVQAINPRVAGWVSGTMRIHSLIEERPC